MSDFIPTKPKSKLFDKEHNNVKSRKQENNLAKKLGGKRQKASGAVTHHRGDVSTKELLFEAKRTDKDSMSLKKEWLEKITKEALVSNRIPALSIEFGEIEQLVENSWVAVPLRFFTELMDLYRDQEKKDEDES
jgi:hypothetical protein